MLIKRISQITGIERELDLPVTKQQLERYALGEELIQNIFPQLSNSEREFIMTGITDDEWNAHFSEDE